jgi:hypothetical protein
MPTKIEGKVSFDLDTDHYAAIGRVANEWAHFEFDLDYTIWTLAEIRNRGYGACITAQLPSSARRMNAIAALISEHEGSKDLKKEFNKFAERTNVMTKVRNRIIHDSWGKMASGQHARLEITAEKKLEFSHKTVSTEEVWKRSEEIRGHREAFKILRNKIFKELGFKALRLTSPGTPP